MSDPLARLAQRLAGDAQFLAALLAEVARAEALDENGLAQALGCPVETLADLWLCRAPRPDPAAFRADVRHLAERFGLDATRLMEVVRRGEAFRRLRAGAAGTSGMLMAARDQEEEPPDPAGDLP